MSEFAARVERGQTVTLSVVDGDLLVDGGTIGTEGGRVEVRGTVVVRHKGVVRGSLTAEAVKGDGPLTVEGDLYSEEIRLENGASLEVGGDLGSELLDVPRLLKVKGRSKIEDMKVGGEAELIGDAEVESAHVGGALRATGKLTAEDVKVGGTVEAKEIKCEDAKVGGTLIAERIEAENVKVGGTATITTEAVIEVLDVGGTVRLQKGNLEDARVGGMMEGTDAVQFERLDVGGRLLLGSGVGDSVRVGGLLEVQHDLTLKDELVVGGEARINGVLEAESVNVGGDLQSEEVRARGSVRVGRNLLTNKGTKAAEVSISRHGRVTGPIVGQKVRIESDAAVEDVYADELRIGESSSVTNVYASRMEVGDSCRVAGRLQYTSEIRIGRNVQFSSQPEKVSSLPGPPI
jgi:cytoskeletal protein CcmA (bactofilin family)